jgi:hypothetical protein
MITRVMIELEFDESLYADRRELESVVCDELLDLMRSDIMAGARVDTIPTIHGARVDIVPNVNNKLSNHCKNCGNENWARITADPSGITYCNECELIR